LNGEIQARLVFDAERLGVDRDKVPPKEVVLERLESMESRTRTSFMTPTIWLRARRSLRRTGVTDGALLKGVRFFESGKRTHSMVMTTESRHIRFVDTLHIEGAPTSDPVFKFKCVYNS